jgi:hypothetical protein
LAATPYKPISFSPNEFLTRAKLNAMTNNDQWLFENTIRGSYSAHNIRRSAGIKIAAGVATFAPTTTGGRWVPIYFGSFFSVGCRPVVVATPTGNGSGRLLCAVTSLNANASAFADHVGFAMWMTPDAGVTASLARIYRTVYGSWIAVGW